MQIKLPPPRLRVPARGAAGGGQQRVLTLQEGGNPTPPGTHPSVHHHERGLAVVVVVGGMMKDLGRCGREEEEGLLFPLSSILSHGAKEWPLQLSGWKKEK